MRFRLRHRVRLGPFRLNLNERGYQSWTFRLLGWSWNSRSRRWIWDSPGPGSVHFGKSNRRG